MPRRSRPQRVVIITKSPRDVVTKRIAETRNAPTIFADALARVEVLDGGMVQLVFVERRREVTDDGVEHFHEVTLNVILPWKEATPASAQLQQAATTKAHEGGHTVSPLHERPLLN